MSGDPPKLLVSACLLGRPVRYDGSAKPVAADDLDRWRAEGRVIAACPELLAGLSTPRPPAEIRGAGGGAVLAGDAAIVEADGNDVTAAYVAGAHGALAMAVRQGCRYALLADGSPSCGVSFIHDGRFAGRRVMGEGVAAALLRRHGIEPFGHGDLGRLSALMDQD